MRVNKAYKFRIYTTKEQEEKICDCGATHDRDINAAKNIEREGLYILRGVGITTHIHTQSLSKSSEDSNIESSTSYEALNKQDVKILCDKDMIEISNLLSH